MIPKDQIEKVQNTADIVDIIGERIDIRRAGANYKARCPFHDEKTPSFMISDAKQIFKCFGCGASGDAVKFLMMYDNISYPDAVRSLAARYGIELKEEYDGSGRDRSEENEKDLLRELNRMACDLFHEKLIEELKNERSAVRNYVQKRKIPGDLTVKFRLGYAPDEWNALGSDSRFSSYKDDVLVSAGLRKKNDKGNVYDQFRNRLIFPVFDQLGNVAAFSGRTLDDNITPKYLNSPETLIYKKSQQLYGFHQAMESIRKTRTVILVEGNVDLLSMHKHGFTNTAAICGTAFTENHAGLIKRNADRVFLMLDGDNAGMRSALKSSEILLSVGIAPEIILLPDELDPDGYLNSMGAEAMKDLMSRPVSLVDLIVRINDLRFDSSNGKISAVRTFAEHFRNIGDRLALELYIKEASERSGTDPSLLKKELLSKKQGREKQRTADHVAAAEEYYAGKDDTVEFTLIYLMISNEMSRKEILAKITESDLQNQEAGRMFLKIYESEEEGEPVKLNNILIDFDDKFKDFMISFVMSQDSAYSAAGGPGAEKEHERKMMTACYDSLRIIELRKMTSKIKRLNAELKYTGDPQRLDSILEEISRLKKEQAEVLNNNQKR